MEIISRNPMLSDDDLREAFSEGYPFGPRKHHPYKIWLNEIKRVMEAREKIRKFNEGGLLL